MNLEESNKTDIKAYLVIGLALLFAWFGLISWAIAILFCISQCTLKIEFKRRNE